MVRNLASTIGTAAILVLCSAMRVLAAQAEFGTEQEAKAMLEKAVAALKGNKQKALEMFNKGEGGFKDRDLYVFCANASDGVVTAHPYLKGENMQDIVGKKGFPVGKEIMRTATEGKVKEVTYWWPRPGSDKRSRSMRSIRRSEIRTAGSATTRNDGGALTSETTDVGLSSRSLRGPPHVSSLQARRSAARSTPEEAASPAGRYMAELEHVVVSPA